VTSGLIHEDRVFGISNLANSAQQLAYIHTVSPAILQATKCLQNWFFVFFRVWEASRHSRRPCRGCQGKQTEGQDSFVPEFAGNQQIACIDMIVFYRKHETEAQNKQHMELNCS
jgi:hypothetical protein